MRLTLLAALPLLAAAFASPVAAQEEAIMERIESIHGDSVAFGEAFGLLQDAFLFGDPTTIADLAFYPLTVEANGELYDLLAPQDLVDNFDYLLTTDTQAALAGQDFADLIVTSDGVGFANGALWMTNACLDDGCSQTAWGIIRITN